MSMSAAGRVVVFGSEGLVGGGAVRALVPAWTVTTVSRRPGGTVGHLRLDLRDAAACRQQLGALGDVTQVVYAALYEQPALVAGWRDAQQIEINRTMLANALGPLISAGGLRHVCLLQGTKAYGAHLRPMRIPGRESDPRPAGPNFYWAQQDWLAEHAAGVPVTVLRPQIVCGPALGSPMNMTVAIGVYAALMRDLGEALTFPGGGSFFTEATDADLLGRAIRWALENPQVWGSTFNVTNGDVLRWHELFEDFAAYFGLPFGGAQPRCLQRAVADLGGRWQQLATRTGLRVTDLDALLGSSWEFADAVFGYGSEQPASTLLSTIRIRQAGFGDCVDTAAMFRRQFAALRQDRILPP